MKYKQAYSFISSLYNIPRKEYLANAKDCIVYLQRTQILLDILGNPEKKIPHYIHVTGTSGKGSVCLMLSSIIKTIGKKVGTLTSPSPDGLLGRTEINGVAMKKNEFTKLVGKIKNALNKYAKVSSYDTPSPFEILTALSLLYFAEKKVQWAVIEVGLGGRYDSTNVIPYKDVAVITNIGLDHVNLIGPTKKDIAYEKAGIIKAGCKVFTTEKDKKILEIIKRECKKSNVKLKIPNPKYQKQDADLFSANFIYQDTQYRLPTIGAHQIANAILSINIAQSLNIPTLAIQKGLSNVKLPIRMEVISKNPLIILDGAHNPDKMRTTVKAMQELRSHTIFPVLSSAEARSNHHPLSFAKERVGRGLASIHLVVGFSADKNIPAMIKKLASLKPASIACTRFTLNKYRAAAKPDNLAKQFKKLLSQTKIQTFLNPKQALSWSQKIQKNDNIILVTGSIFLAGELRDIFKN